MSIIKAAIEEAGGGSAVARSLGIGRVSVWEWVNKGAVPDPRVLQLAELTHWKYTPHQLAPSLYPNPTDGLPVQVLGEA